MFVVYIGSILTTAIWLAILAGQTDGGAAFTGSVALWLWFTVLFANFAEALAEGRSKAQAESLRGTKKPAGRKAGRPAPRRRYGESGRRKPAQGRYRAGGSRRHHPMRRRSAGRRRLGG